MLRITGKRIFPAIRHTTAIATFSSKKQAVKGAKKDLETHSENSSKKSQNPQDTKVAGTKPGNFYKRWTQEEKDEMVQLVKARLSIGEIAKKLGRTPQSIIFKLYTEDFEKAAKNGQWSKQEDLRLLELSEAVNKKNWGAVSNGIPGRNRHQCRSRYNYLYQLKKLYALDKESQKMIENIRYEDGSSIKHLFDMINLSIAEEGADEGENAELENAAMSREKEGEFRRFRNWTPESDKELLQLVEKHGEKWTKVASLMSGTPCSTIAVYSRYKTLQRAIKGKVVKIRKKHKPTSKWSAEDSEKLKNLVTESLEKEEIFSWKKISEKMGDRTSSQCRYRYINYLSPFLNTSGKFTAKEDYLILSHVMGHDKISWVKISQALSYTRSEVHVRSRSQSTINIYLLLKSYGINLKLQKNITSLDQIDTSDPDYILFEKTRELCLCHKYFVRPSEEALKKLFISH